MNFFIPDIDEVEETEEVYRAMRDWIRKSISSELTPRRIFKLEYRHEGKSYTSEVGQIDPQYGELIIAIFESIGTYYICTETWGTQGGDPIKVKADEIFIIEDF